MALEDDNNREEFVRELMSTTKVSRQYAESAWHTLEDFRRTKPKAAAKYYKERWSL